MNNFSDYCPKGGDTARFNGLSERIVANYMNAPTLRSQRDIERDIDKLRRLLADLADDVRTELISREYQDMKGAEYSEILKVALDGGSTLEKLERHVKAKFKRDVRHDASARADLIKFAIANFEAFGGKLSARAQSPFVHYLDALAVAANIDPFDAPKAMQDFASRHI